MNVKCDIAVIWTAVISYSISAVLLFFLQKQDYIFTTLNREIESLKEERMRTICKTIMTFAFPVILTTTVFWMILLQTGLLDGIGLFMTVGLILGEVLRTVIKNIDRKEPDDGFLFSK